MANGFAGVIHAVGDVSSELSPVKVQKEGTGTVGFPASVRNRIR